MTMNVRNPLAIVAALAVLAIAGTAMWDVSAQASEAKAPADSYAISTTSFACGNIMQEWQIAVDETLPQEAIDAMIDGACEALEGNYQEQPEQYTSVMTCFDGEGMVTTGDNWRECFPMNVETRAS